MLPRPEQFTKFFVVLLCLTSWLAASNHCVLTSLQHQEAVESCCAHRTKSAPAETSSMNCCQVLQLVEHGNVIVPSPAKALTSDFTLFASAILLPVSREEPRAIIRPRDPPPSGLASSVDLQRCHPAIAPPYSS